MEGWSGCKDRQMDEEGNGLLVSFSDLGSTVALVCFFCSRRERGLPKNWCPDTIAIRIKGKMKYNGGIARAINIACQANA